MIFAMDNLAALAAFTKGRSRKAPLAQLCRAFAALSLSYNLVMLIKWVRSEKNHADGPSRQKALGYFCSGVQKETIADAMRSA